MILDVFGNVKNFMESLGQLQRFLATVYRVSVVLSISKLIWE